MRALALLVALGGCKPAPPTPAAADQPVTISIAAINDWHGALYEMRVKGQDGVAFGGLPWLKAAIDALRAEDPDLVLLDGGDEFQGSWPVNASKGIGAIRAMELIGVDAAAVGNHEFDYTAEALEAAAREADYPLLGANIYEADEPWRPDGIGAWTVIERKGKRLGVVGLTTEDTPTTTVPKHVAHLEFRDVVKTVQDLLPELEAADLDATVLVAHLTGACEPKGYLVPGEPCTPGGEVGRLLTELPPGTFDVMVLGHAHTLLAHRVGDTFVLENRASGHAVGRVDLVFGPDGLDLDASRLRDPWGLMHDPVDPGCSGEPFPLDPILVGGRVLAPDPGALELIGALEAEAGSRCEEIACASRTLGRDRAGESELGNWMSDAMRATFPDAQIAVQNSGGIRADLLEGPVRREHLQQVMPFDNRTVLVELTGAQVRTLFRIGSSGAHGILQTSGATYRADPERDASSDLDGNGEIEGWERDHLCDVRVGGEPLNDEATYTVVTSDFLLTGGDHLGPAFQGARVLDEGPLLREALFRYAEATDGCIGDAPIIAPEAPRISLGRCP